MPAFMKWGETPRREAIDGTTSTFLFAEQPTPEENRLYVGNLSLDQTVNAPEKMDEVLVSFEHGEAEHPDFIWFPAADPG
jgi:hypothetical protein